MASSITVLTGTESFAKRSTARAGVGQETEQREMVRTEGEEGHGIDGPGLTDPVDRICESRPGLIIGLMVGVMRPPSWAFTGPLILDPSVRRLALSPAREAPGRDSVRWLISRTGSGRR